MEQICVMSWNKSDFMFGVTWHGHYNGVVLVMRLLYKVYSTTVTMFKAFAWDQTNNSVIFFIQYSLENTALLLICITFLNPKTKCLSTINALNQLKHHHTHPIWKKNSTLAWVLSLIKHSASPRTVLASRPHSCAIFFPHCTWGTLQYFN